MTAQAAGGGTGARAGGQAGWSVARIAAVLFPFGAGAMAVNVFFASLIGSWLGGPVLSALWSILIGAVIGVPATWAFARHIRRLMDEANARADAEQGRCPERQG